VLAVPAVSKAAALAGIAKYQPFTLKRWLYRLVTTGLIRMGAARLAAVSRVSPVGGEFRFDFAKWCGQLEDCLGRRIAHAIVTWPPQPWRRRLYVHLLDTNLQAFAFVKVASTDDDHTKLAVEAEALNWLAQLPLQKIRAPRLVHHGRFEEVGYLAMEPLPTVAKPLKLAADCDSAPLTAEFRGEFNRLSGPEIRSLSWWEAYTQALRPEHQAFHAQLQRLMPLGAETCRAHGDLGLANMVRDEHQIWIFDWESCHAAAPALADSIGFFMSFTMAKTERQPLLSLRRIEERFLTEHSDQRRLAVMLALAFRHACGIPDAVSIIGAWEHNSLG
jgi:Phosphotransferase enzyme family